MIELFIINDEGKKIKIGPIQNIEVDTNDDFEPEYDFAKPIEVTIESNLEQLSPRMRQMFKRVSYNGKTYF